MKQFIRKLWDQLNHKVDSLRQSIEHKKNIIVAFEISPAIPNSEDFKSGFVYIIESLEPEYRHLLKIGLSNDPIRRVSQINNTATGLYGRVRLLKYYTCDDMFHTEKYAHQILKPFNIQIGSATEWFNVNCDQAMNAIINAGGREC